LPDGAHGLDQGLVAFGWGVLRSPVPGHAQQGMTGTFNVSS
jgi:hypothetical protein